MHQSGSFKHWREWSVHKSQYQKLQAYASNWHMKQPHTICAYCNVATILSKNIDYGMKELSPALDLNSGTHSGTQRY